ncbi:MAG: tetratricopeptide repeat protein [Gemmataceae bacterium]|nr:tetratricopeptide repeat protein [Gemmataceae bacterium]MDW8264831.1 tetratricopeptide repeat protein [Gemmataceae bacterium]
MAESPRLFYNQIVPTGIAEANVMGWLLSEYILKGTFLGLGCFVMLQQPDPADSLRVMGYTGGGLLLCLVLAAVGKLREGYRIRGQWLAFVLFLLLESPTLVYAGILGGMTVGSLTIPMTAEELPLWRAVAAGSVAGLVFYYLRQLRHPWGRFALALGVAAAAAIAAISYLQSHPEFPAHRQLFAGQLLFTILFFYLLTFAGEAEESEVEIAAMCAALGVGLYVAFMHSLPTLQSLCLAVPVAIYYLYTRYVLRQLRVFKYALRGLSYARIGQYRKALAAFRRALHLDPQYRLARSGLWAVHRSLDLDQLAKDPSMLEVVDLELCLERAASLLVAGKPTDAALAEANRLLDLAASQRPALRPTVDYWRTVALLHARQYEQAADVLTRLLDPEQTDRHQPHRQAILFQAWQLALMLHPEMHRRVGTPQLALPGRRMEAIAAVERRLAEQPDDSAAWDLKRLLYANLTEADYQATAATGGPVEHFDHSYAQQLGLALIDDPVHWRRGAEFLRIAARGQPASGPSLYTQIAQAHHKAGDVDGFLHHLELAKRAGAAIGHQNLSESERHAYFAAIKTLAEQAAARNDLAKAIENYHLYSEYERSGLETLRILTDLYERLGDPLKALRVNEQALLFDPTNPELLERKDKYYYSVMPEDLKARLSLVRDGFDTAYCLKKARGLLDNRAATPEVIDWALHLAKLAEVVQPQWLRPRYLQARAHLLRGERDQAVALLEDIWTHRPEKFADAEDEEAWYACCQRLGRLYLDELGKPEEALRCFLEFRKSPKSGADTIFRLGQCYEALGDLARAAKCYEQVTAYDGHPLVYEARAALYRVQGSS